MKRSSVLIVEDDDVMREMLRRALDEQYEVRAAPSGERALELWQERPADCVLIDYRLRDCAGLELLPRLANPAPALIMISALSDERVSARALHLGASDFLLKRDITPEVLRASVRQALLRREREAQEEVAADELRNFVRTAAHDIKAPVRHIVGFTEMALRKMEGGDLEGARRSLGTVLGAAARMSGLVEALRAHTRVESHPAKLSLVDLDQTVKSLLQGMAGDLAALRGVVQTEDLPTVLGDPDLLSQLMQNLLENALKYHGEQPLKVAVSAERVEAGWQLRVADNGIGIRKDLREAAFSPLRQVHGGGYSGYGLGLHTCRRIATRHGGRIWAESVEGGGTAICLTLPAAPAGS